MGLGKHADKTGISFTVVISKLCVAVHLYLKLKFLGCNDKVFCFAGLSTHWGIGSARYWCIKHMPQRLRGGLVPRFTS